MSHFTVMVTNTQDSTVEEQLERYYEQGEEGDYFMDKEIEVPAEDMEKRAKELLKDDYVIKNPDTLKKYKQLIKEKKFTELCKDWHGGALDDEGNLYFLTNYDAHWDWYVTGGRWSGFFKLKKGVTGELGEPSFMQARPVGHVADIAKVKDIDWKAMRKQNVDKAKKNWAEWEKQKDLPNPLNSYFEYGIKKDQTKEDYIKQQSSIAPFAVVHDGEWFERGTMGWWAIVTDEKETEDWDVQFESILKQLDLESEVTLVDCHI